MKKNTNVKSARRPSKSSGVRVRRKQMNAAANARLHAEAEARRESEKEMRLARAANHDPAACRWVFKAGLRAVTFTVADLEIIACRAYTRRHEHAALDLISGGKAAPAPAPTQSPMLSAFAAVGL